MRQPRASARVLRRPQQHRPDAAPAHMRGDRDRIEPRDRRARPEQHDRRAGEAAAFIRHDHLGGRRLQEMAEAAARQAVGREHPLLELHQRVEVCAFGFANADVRHRNMGETGGHCDQQDSSGPDLPRKRADQDASRPSREQRRRSIMMQARPTSRSRHSLTQVLRKGSKFSADRYSRRACRSPAERRRTRLATNRHGG